MVSSAAGSFSPGQRTHGESGSAAEESSDSTQSNEHSHSQSGFAQRKLKVSDDELVRRRQEVKSLKEQIHGSRSLAGDFRTTVSAGSNRSDRTPSKSPPPVPKRENADEGPPGTRHVVSPGFQQDAGQKTHMRMGYFDELALPRNHDSYEVEHLRTKLGEMEAKLLKTQSELVKERESSRTAKARLAMDLQRHMSSAESGFVRSQATLELQLQLLRESLERTQAELDSERKERQVREVEVDRMRQALSVYESRQSIRLEDSVKPGDGLCQKVALVADSKKIQDLPKANLALLSQKRNTVKNLLAMNTEICDICLELKETIHFMRSPLGMQLADGMLATEIKALFMAQLQAQSKIQITDSEIDKCREELEVTRAELTELRLQLSESERKLAAAVLHAAAAAAAKEEVERAELTELRLQLSESERKLAAAVLHAAAAAAAKKEAAEQKRIGVLNKENAGDPTSAAGGAAPAPSAFMQPKDIPKKFCNVRPSGVVQGAKSAEGLSANSFKKSLIMGGRDYMAEFRTKFGSTAADIVDTLTKRHTMLNPLLQPVEPYMDVFEETWNPFKPSRDTGTNSGEELVFKLSKELAARNNLFEDPIFPADETSLFADPAAAGRNASAEQTFRKDQDAFLAGVTGIEWKRPNEWGDTTAKVVMWSGGIDPDDVAQGRLGNCYYLAAIAGCATGGNDVLLKDVCIENYGNVGLYGVKFFINGKWATVIVDDRIPCEKVGSGWKPIFASPKVHSGQRKGEKELWPMIFEKAWAKLHLSYEATAGGFTQDACSYLSGGLTSVRNLERGSDNTDIWDECVALTAADGGDTFAFLSCAVRGDQDPSHLGLITGHAYSILRLVKAKDGHKFVQIRNPWGESEWTGDYCDSSPLWTPALKKELGYKAEEDGAFFMSWEHFVMWFESIEICDATGLMKMTEGELCRVDGFSSHWVAKKTAGGGPSCCTFKYNPTVTITVGKDCQLALTLLQPDVRPMFQPDQEDLQNKMASAYIWPSDTPEKDIAKLLAGQGPVCECLPWSRQATGIVPLKKGVKYNVTGCTFAPGQEGAFTITMCGQGLAVTPKLFDTPTPEHAGYMGANWDPYGCCVSCHNTMDGSFYSTSKGPTCPGCALGKPPKAKVWPKPEEAMNNPHLSAFLYDTTPVAAPQPEKVVAEAKAAAENAPVQLIMTLSLDFSMAGSEGSDKREKFMRDVAEDLASASGRPPANFRIKDVSPGSIIILDMEVMPDPLAPGTHLLAAKDLAEQAVDPSSTLRSGKITSHAIGVEVVAQKRKDEALDELRNVGNGADAEVFSPAAKNEKARAKRTADTQQILQFVEDDLPIVNVGTEETNTEVFSSKALLFKELAILEKERDELIVRQQLASLKKDNNELIVRLEKSEEQVKTLQSLLNSKQTARYTNTEEVLSGLQKSEGISMKLDMKMKDVENSVEFVQAVKLDLCTALGISASRIQMHGLRAGTVIVDMGLQEGSNSSDRTPGELLLELFRQMRDPCSQLMRSSMTNKTMSIELYASDVIYQQNIKTDRKLNDSSDPVDDSTRSTSSWIGLVEQQTEQLRRQTADIINLEDLNRILTTELDAKEGAVIIIRQTLEERQKEAQLLHESNESLADQLQRAEQDSSNWKRAFKNLEAQLNEHNVLIKMHLKEAENRADGLHREKLMLASELEEVTQKYLRASQDTNQRESFQSVDTASSTKIMSPRVSPTPKMTRSAPPPVTTPPPPTKNEKQVDMNVILELNFETVGTEGSIERTKFETLFVQDLANSSGLPTSLFSIKELSTENLQENIMSVRKKPARRSVIAFRFISKPDGDNYAECDGIYEKDSRELNSWPIYVCKPRERFLCFNGETWIITGNQWLEGILEKQERGFDGFHSNNCPGEEIVQGWDNYDVELIESAVLEGEVPGTAAAGLFADGDPIQHGCVLVDFCVRSDPLIRGPVPLEVAVDFEKQASDRNSRLCNGAVTKYVKKMAVHPCEHEEYKFMREENQRLRNQISNLRAEVLKDDSEIKDLSENLKEDQQEHLRITSAMQTQIETYFSQLTNAQNYHQQLSSLLTAAENRNLKAEQEKEVLLEELKMACKTKDDIAAMVENLQCRNQELQDRLEEAEKHLQKVAKVLSDEHLKVVQLGECGEDLARNNEDLLRAVSKEQQERKVVHKAWQHSQELVEQLAEKLSQVGRDKEEVLAILSKVKEEKEVALKTLYDAEKNIMTSGGEFSNANKQIHDLQIQGVQLAQTKILLEDKLARLSAMHNKEKDEILRALQVSRARVAEMEEELSSSRQMSRSCQPTSDIHSTQISQPSSEHASQGNVSDELSPGRIVPFGSFSVSRGMQEDIEMRIADPHQIQVKIVQPQQYAPPRSPPGLVSSPPPLLLSPHSRRARDSMQGSQGSIYSPCESLMGSFADSIQTPKKSIFSKSEKIPIHDTKPTFPASTQISLFQTKPTYQGELKDGWPHGRGITVWPDRRVYDGHWVTGVFQGIGTCIWSNGDTYEGEWQEGFAHGLGTYSYATGDVFEGTFKQDRFCGHGVLTTAQGVKYRGCWENCLLTGWALVILSSGEKIKQFFRQGTPAEAEGVQDENSYGALLLAVSEVVHLVRRQTEDIRQMRSLQPSPGRWDQQQGNDIQSPQPGHNTPAVRSNASSPQLVYQPSSSSSDPPPRLLYDSIPFRDYGMNLTSLTPTLRRNTMIPGDAIHQTVSIDPRECY